MASSPSAEPSSALLTLLDLAHRARAAGSADELAFLLVNDSRRLLPYRQAVLWFDDGRAPWLSGIVQAEANAPYVQWIAQLCRSLPRAQDKPSVHAVAAEALAPELAAQWDEWLPRDAIWIALPASAAHPGSAAGGLLLAGDEQQAAAGLKNPQLYPLLEEWAHAWHHAWLARLRPRPWSSTQWRRLLAQWWRGGAGQAWWKRRPLQVALALALLSVCPVRLTVLAPGELVPSNPAAVRAPLDGVIAQFHVQPNEPVKAGQALFSFDEAAIASRLDVARHALASAQAEYRQQAQMALSDLRSKSQLVVLQGKIGEKQADVDYLASLAQRAQVLAPRDGIALFDDASEWIGRPVQTGERIMKIAAPEEIEVEAWIPIGDAIPLPAAAAVKLYLASTPFDPLQAELRYLGHEAMARADGNYAYRLRAKLSEPTTQRIGLKGTVKVQGPWVPLAYWVFRRPLALIRQTIAY
jgi:hypothetical protein